VSFAPLADVELAAAVALTNRAMAVDRVPQVLAVAELREQFEAEGVALATDTLAARDRTGALVGYIYTWYLPSGHRHERCYLVGEVDPDRRGAGIGRTLLAWAMDRGAEQLRASGRDLPRRLLVDAYDHLPDRHGLYRAAGFAPVRWFQELLRPLAELPPLQVPAGIELLDWPAPAGDEALRRLRNRAFADHWGSTDFEPAAWRALVRGFAARPDLSLVAAGPGGEPVGCCVCHRYPEDDGVLGRRDGWIEVLGTDPAWRGRGVATALVVAALHRFAAAGLTHAALGVDRDSPTGARDLYGRLGFALWSSSTTYELLVG
jgi:mycothiol synthase